jgi:hypothetical protein
MKKIFSLVWLLLSVTIIDAQSVAINTTGTAASSNAILDVSSTNKGVFVPRMTTAQRKAIAVTANDNGLLVFDKDRNMLHMFDGVKWVPFATATDETIAYSGSITDPPVAEASSYGYAVAVDSMYAVIGAPNDDIGANQLQGSAHVFKKQNGHWIQMAQLAPSDPQAAERFGYSVAIKGDYIVVGAPKYTHNPGINNACGAAYIFHRVGNNWVQVMKLRESAPAFGQNFGESVDMNSSTIVVGCPGYFSTGVPGAVYVYTLTGNTWQLETILHGNVAEGNHLGMSVSISKTNNYIIAGAPRADNAGSGLTDCGAVYIFSNFQGNWYQHSKLLQNSPSTQAFFGNKVSFYNNLILVADDKNVCQLFTKPGALWTFSQVYNNPTPNFNSFGDNVRMHENYMFISATEDQALGMEKAGVVFVYKKNSAGAFVFHRRMTDMNSLGYDYFGTSVSFDGFNLLIGSPGSTYGTAKGKVIFNTVSD